MNNKKKKKKKRSKNEYVGRLAIHRTNKQSGNKAIYKKSCNTYAQTSHIHTHSHIN